MNYKSGDVFFTDSGAFLFVNEGTEIKLVSLYRPYPMGDKGVLISMNNTKDNLSWLSEYSDSFDKINLYDLFEKIWPKT